MQDRFKRLLEEKNLTATKFAALIKVNASAMSHILNGRSKPGFDVLDKIGQAFPEISMNWLISGKGKMYLSESFPNRPAPMVERSLFEAEEKKTEETAPYHPPAPHVIPETEESRRAGGCPATGKKIKRIVLFFEDGSFEDYEQNQGKDTAP